MNLFILNYMPVLAAKDNCDKHVRKIILESVEMMAYAFDDGTFKPWPWISKTGKYTNHPMSIWVRSSKQNFDWTLQHAYALSEEYTFRWGKTHKCLDYINWIAGNLPMRNLPDHGQTDWPRCFGKFKDQVGITNDAINDYRRYYMIAKKHLAEWTKRPVPDWYH